MNDVLIQKYLDRIVSSKTFSHSDVYGKLLSYLVKATLKGEKPKEYTIGADVFNQKADSPSTSKVRVSVHNLRKKLDAYYKEEGHHDSVKFSIPKGTYTLVFENRKDRIFPQSPPRALLIILSFVVLLLITFLFLMNSFFAGSEQGKFKKTKFWGELISNKKETIIVIGDFFIFEEKGSSKEKEQTFQNTPVQDIMQDRIKEHPDEGYILPKNNSYIPYAAILSLPQLIPLLDRNEVNYKIVLSSNFRWETFNNDNIIYIGSLENLNALSYLTDNKLHIKYTDFDHAITLSDEGGKRVYKSSIENNIITDYTLVAKLPGPSNNLFYLFGSSHELGCIESIKYFTQIDSLKSFGQKVLGDAAFFKAIYKAEGVERINIEFELVEYETISDSILTNFWHY